MYRRQCLRYVSHVAVLCSGFTTASNHQSKSAFSVTVPVGRLPVSACTCIWWRVRSASSRVPSTVNDRRSRVAACFQLWPVGLRAWDMSSVTMNTPGRFCLTDPVLRFAMLPP